MLPDVQSLFCLKEITLIYISKFYYVESLNNLIFKYFFNVIGRYGTQLNITNVKMKAFFSLPF